MEKRVIELFAGVGGFRVGLNKIKDIDCDGHAIENGKFKFVWANQWEPSTKTQHAYECYKLRFNSDENEISNEDINKVNKKNIPDHTLLCGGFPCQDYSVAHSLAKEKGIEGKKGVLWWDINEILTIKKPPFVLLENVDRLIKSPSKQRGRDFAIMLRCFSENGYGVEWRVINAADYGYPQRRKRIYIFAFRKSTNYYKKTKKETALNVLNNYGLFSYAFPIEVLLSLREVSLLENYKDLVDLSNNFTFNFNNAGLMIDGNVFTNDIVPHKNNPTLLKNILENKVDEHFYLSEERIKKFEYLRDRKKIARKKPNGESYWYSEGAMSKYDSIELPGRTMLTSEGTTNRSTHIIKDKKGIRILTPIECERLNQFPDNWTNTMTERKRYFMMGNALVCGVINKLGDIISEIIDNEK